MAKSARAMLLAVCLSLSRGQEVTSSWAHGETGCVWYGECGPSGQNNGYFNCLNEGQAKPPDLHRDELLRKLCPSLLGPTGEIPSGLCCDHAQLMTFRNSIDIAAKMLSGCPSSWLNFLTLHCTITCSPHQITFMKGLAGSETDQGKVPIVSVEVYLDADYIGRVYNSTKSVLFRATNMPAMELMCGQSVADCSPQAFVNHMGSPSNKQTPFPINFKIASGPQMDGDTNRTFHPVAIPTYNCHDTPHNEAPCSCSDCETACPLLKDPPPAASPCLFLKMDCAWTISIILYAVLGVAFVLYVAQYWLHQNSGSVSPVALVSSSLSLGVESELRQGTSLSKFDRAGAHLEDIIQRFFFRWGLFCARRPAVVLLTAAMFLGFLCTGLAFFTITTDPVLLWSAPSSRARLEKNFFDEHFGRFYRTEQIIIRPTKMDPVFNPLSNSLLTNNSYSAVFRKEFLMEVFEMERHLSELVVTVPTDSNSPDLRNVTLQDICYKPLAPENANCAIMSISQYFQSSVANLDEYLDDMMGGAIANYIDHAMFCAGNPILQDPLVGLPCRGIAGIPAPPHVILGGYTERQFANATALIVTFLVNNPNNRTKTEEALAWEKAAISYLKSYPQKNITISFMMERSIEDEIQRESEADVKTVFISYMVMFIYITLTLGQYSTWDRILVDSKVTLGIAGVVMVFVSFAASVGFYSYCGLPATLIIIEVIPFLVLAVGVDNIFILVQTFQRDQAGSTESIDLQVARVLAKVGPSMLLSSSTDSFSFFIGAMSTMPVVKYFSLYAAMAVLIDFLLQISCFVSLMTLDAKRQKGARCDVFCCLKGSKKSAEDSPGILYRFVKRWYIPFITSGPVRTGVMLVFMGWFMSSVAVLNKINVGFDQKTAMPEDSYVLNHMIAMEDYLLAGAPVYFVVDDGLDFTDVKVQKKICSASGCDPASLTEQIFEAHRGAPWTKIATPASSWLDDYIDWLNPRSGTPCCQILRSNSSNNSFCPSSMTDRETACQACKIKEFVNYKPAQEDFMTYIPFFLGDNPSEKCPKAGRAAYGSGVNIHDNLTAVGASYFMTYHTVCRTSGEYTEALLQARALAENITATLGVRVFPYSVFYVFYEQYLTIVRETVENLSFSLGAIFIMTFLLLGLDWHSALIVCFTITMIEIDLMAVMYWWEIDLNAVSLVNLVMGVGISVEFCSHLMRAFAISMKSGRIARAQDALRHMGISVFSGITLTKFGGIVVLGFSHSQIFRTYYFRMYLSMVLIGAAHGLVFLPVLLTYLGPPVNKARLQYQLDVPADAPGKENKLPDTVKAENIRLEGINGRTEN
ncbi:Niemann-Pick C1 protein [Hypsibius exemplaris]|uniref:Niemann-Pick C1 protein n=1 Tax=Hypsibius exemplaris TaxID=2072580 RepID=A0A1W0X5X6_HYPEX|nr:Niemann-Pick C1 protein [Hypsibius exemplaris]